MRDGLAAVATAAPGCYDAIVVDAGSGDAAAAMSCPPPAFLAADFLRQVHASRAMAFGTAADANPKPHVRGSHVQNLWPVWTVLQACRACYSSLRVQRGHHSTSCGTFCCQACAALAPGGVLVVNCVTRSEAAFAGAVAALKDAFPQACA